VLMGKVRVMVVDDHAVVREGLRSILNRERHLEVVGEAVDGEDACVQAAALRPEIVIMDVSMPRLNGADATRRVLAVSPASSVIALTAHDEPPYVRELLNAGARGYVLKRAVIEDLVRAIAVVSNGGLFLDPELAKRTTPSAAPNAGVLSVELTSREIEVASMTALGHSNAEIAARLKLAVKTVETHKARLMDKLGLRTRAQLVRYALYRGWVKT
jgi:DNA-binding NarL/FixJ family response regulator